MPQKFLDSADVIVVLQEMSGEGMAEGVRANPLGDARLPGRSPDGLLQAALVQVVAAHNATAGVYG